MNKDKKIEMLTQPLLTEDGFLNESCIKELHSVLNNMPETHERLADDPEWNTKYWTTDTDILKYLAGCSVELFSGYPPNLDSVINFTRACMRHTKFMDKCDTDDRFRIAQLSLCEINKMLWDMLGDISYFLDWNDSKKHKHWISLSALLHNVCIDIRNDRRHSRSFDMMLKREEDDNAEV